MLRGVTFAIAAGEFCGLIGSNGSGKTTLLRTVVGLIRHDAGTIEVGLGGRRTSIGYVPQRTAFDPYMPVRARDLVGLGFDGHRLGLPFRTRTRDMRVDEMLEAVDARAFADQRIGELSGGQQQRVLIAHALIRRPALLLLDEALANLDVRSVAGIVALLRRVATEFGVAVVLSAHDMNPLLSAIDRVVYLARGRAASGNLDTVVRTDVLSDLYGYHVDVIRVHGRILVIAGGDEGDAALAVEHDPTHVMTVP